MTTASEILAYQDRKLEKVTVDEWGGAEVFIRTMGAIERSKYEAKLIENKEQPLSEKMVQVKVMLVILCVCDETGKRLFGDNDFNAVAEKSADAIDRLFDVINRVNLITQSEIKAESGN